MSKMLALDHSGGCDLPHGEKEAAPAPREAVGQESATRAARDLEPCRVCGEYETPGGQTCYRCALNLEEDRLERESGR